MLVVAAILGGTLAVPGCGASSGQLGGDCKTSGLTGPFLCDDGLVCNSHGICETTTPTSADAGGVTGSGTAVATAALVAGWRGPTLGTHSCAR
jgi:hypothetical protein